MPKSENKTVASDADVMAFLQAVDHPVRRADSLILHDLFAKESGYQAKMWGPSIVGFGRYHYVYDSGREGDFLATGFSPRKANLSIYIMPGYQDYSDILSRLGKHKLGKSCLYVNKLADIDLEVLAELIRAGLRDLNDIWPVAPA
ncbi:DUF1801 domain-containing protein [Cognatishimia sp. SS12]|uniref:DUF1801 domain-containing protein n=1 Tax=Cognatishimia sp. SS12 TaxID=2979465 RepID=UPI00233135A1|nr:DUF1801 domain-containing protein [Cognatishimia sp. SS12]MDC0738981.1 DUF1801 domain-containing protein [Cognatishimia sp. SS12]